MIYQYIYSYYQWLVSKLCCKKKKELFVKGKEYTLNEIILILRENPHDIDFKIE